MIVLLSLRVDLPDGVLYHMVTYIVQDWLAYLIFVQLTYLMVVMYLLVDLTELADRPEQSTPETLPSQA